MKKKRFKAIGETIESFSNVLRAVNSGIRIGSSKVDHIATLQDIRFSNEKKKYLLVGEKKTALEVTKAYEEIQLYREQGEQYEALYDSVLEELKQLDR